jgi:hypothetical protein
MYNFVEEIVGKHSLQKPNIEWNGNCKMILRDIVCDYMLHNSIIACFSKHNRKTVAQIYVVSVI